MKDAGEYGGESRRLAPEPSSVATGQESAQVADTDDAPTRDERRARAVTDALRTLVRDLYTEHHGEPPPATTDFPLRLDLRVDAASNWRLAFEPPLLTQVRGQLDDAQAAADVAREGAVYCFRCDSSGCEHSRPPDGLSVFRRYDPMGKPEWMQWTQCLLEEGDARVGDLYEKHPPVLALFQPGKQLKAQQLVSYGKSSKTYALLAQVAAGYVEVKPAPGADAERVALTFQVVESRRGGGRLRLSLNVLARLPGDLLPRDLWQDRSLDWLNHARLRARDRVARLEQRALQAREAGSEEELRAALRGIPAVLRELAQSLERGARQRDRRTTHARLRREDRRPVHKAQDDARTARDDDLFHDEKSRTTMVVGDRGRTHAFGDDGRHVTSFTLPPGGLEQRLRTGRWRPLTPEEFITFHATLQGGPPRAQG